MTLASQTGIEGPSGLQSACKLEKHEPSRPSSVLHAGSPAKLLPLFLGFRGSILITLLRDITLVHYIYDIMLIEPSKQKVATILD